MGLWNFYFIAKFYLHLRGFIRMGLLLNLLFAVFIIIPLPERFRAHRMLRAAKFIISLIFAISLLWKESWLPPPADAFNHIMEQGMPAGGYILGFLLRFFPLLEVILLLGILVLSVLLRHWRMMTPAVLVLLLATSLAGLGKKMDGAGLERHLADFYRSESKRVVSFEKGGMAAPDFDIVILHICSIAWDDLEEGGIDWEPFFGRFQYLFTKFNTVTTYSGPAVIRLMRSSCGQQSHADLYRDAPDGCYLFENLRTLGYKTYFSANHNARYGNFDEEARRFGKLTAPLIPPDDLPIRQYMFDDSLLYDDYRALEKWWNMRENSGSARAALYYNTLTLHDGSHWYPKREEWWKRDRKVRYQEFTGKLLGDIEKFLGLLEASGRNTVVLFVSEHGLALRGSRIQVAGLRDIPLPHITIGPLAIKLIGEGFGGVPQRQQVISTPASHTAISAILAYLFEKGTSGKGGLDGGGLADAIPATDFVAENEGSRVLMLGSEIFFFGKENKWISLPER